MEIRYQGVLFDPNPKVNVAIARATKTVAEYSVGVIRSRTPIDTARLWKGWSMVTGARGVEIRNPTPYASFVELGTRKMSARLMLNRSLPEIEAKFKDALASELQRTLGATKVLGSAKLGAFLAGFSKAAKVDTSRFKPYKRK